MELWLDTIHLETIQKASLMGILNGVTTNPSIIACANKPFEEVLVNILENYEGPIAAQVVADDALVMQEQGERLASFSPRIIVKVPVTPYGIQTISALRAQGIPVMATAIFDPLQALLSFKAGANYLAPYLGKIHDLGENGLGVLEQIQAIQKQYGYDGKIIAAGVRDVKYVKACALMGINAITLRKEIFEQLIAEHYGTAKALANFKQDWKKAKPSELFNKESSLQELF